MVERVSTTVQCFARGPSNPYDSQIFGRDRGTSTVPLHGNASMQRLMNQRRGREAVVDAAAAVVAEAKAVEDAAAAVTAEARAVEAEARAVEAAALAVTAEAKAVAAAAAAAAAAA